MKIKSLDHLVITVNNLEKSVDFYSNVLDMELKVIDGRYSLHFGNQKINIHEYAGEFQPAAINATPGSQDLCFLVSQNLKDVFKEILSKGIKPETDIVDRTGAIGSFHSFYLRDPDGNLIEISSYQLI